MTLISDDLLNNLCTILTRTKTQDTASQEMVDTWANAEVTITGGAIGIGDGATKVFYTPYKAVSEMTALYVNQVAQTTPAQYTVSQLADIDNYAKITFVSAPVLGAIITSDYKHKDSNTVACRLDMAKGGVSVSAKDFLSNRTHVLYMDYRTDINWSDKRIKVGSETFDIVLVADAGGEHDHLEISLNIVE